MQLAILSDWHIGKARSKEFYPASDRETNDYKSLPDDTFLNDFKDLIQSQGISAEYLIIPGDLTNGSHPEQIYLAKEILKKIKKILRARYIFFVPGNHDSDWSISKALDKSGFYHYLRYEAFRNRKIGFGSVVQKNSVNSFDDPFFSFQESNEAFLVGYNSSHNQKPSDDVHFGQINQDHISKLEKILKTKIIDGKTRIFVTHHHPILYSDFPPGIDQSEMQNSELLLEFLSKWKFDMLIHGHKHVPKITVKSHNAGHPLLIIGSGSFSAKMYNDWTGPITNNIHFVKINSARLNGETLTGCVKSFAYSTFKKWIPSDGTIGIEHENYFGNYLTSRQLSQLIQDKINSKIQTDKMVPWQYLLDSHPEIEHVIRTVLEEALDSVKRNLKLRIVGVGKDMWFVKDKDE